MEAKGWMKCRSASSVFYGNATFRIYFIGEGKCYGSQERGDGYYSMITSLLKRLSENIYKSSIYRLFSDSTRP